jgi:hypothetical protein
MMKPKFPLGRTVITRNAQSSVPADDVHSAINRHVVGDWGEVSKEDWAENELSLREGFRLFSVYHATNGARFWVITEADRSSTTVLLPEDY